VAATATTLIKAVASARTALDAELVLCDVFGMLEQENEWGSEGHTEAVGALLTATAGYAQHLATGEALTALQVLASLGPAESRAAAADAVARSVGPAAFPAPGRAGSSDPPSFADGSTATSSGVSRPWVCSSTNTVARTLCCC
jgi:hypothetical protein